MQQKVEVFLKEVVQLEMVQENAHIHVIATLHAHPTTLVLVHVDVQLGIHGQHHHVQ